MHTCRYDATRRVASHEQLNVKNDRASNVNFTKGNNAECTHYTFPSNFMEFQLTFRPCYRTKTAGENFLHTFPEFNTETTNGRTGYVCTM